MEATLEDLTKLHKMFTALYKESGLISVSDTHLHINNAMFKRLIPNDVSVVTERYNTGEIQLSAVVEDIKFITLV